MAMSAGAIAAGVAGQVGGGILGSVINNMFTGHHMLKQYNYSRQLQEQASALQYNYSKKLSKYLNTRQYQWTMQDMKKSGINPMLAISNGINGVSANVSAPTGSVGLGQTSNMDLQTPASSALEAYKDKKRFELENKTADQNIAVGKSQEALNRQSIISQEIQNDIARATTAKDLNIKDAQYYQILKDVENNTNLINSQIRKNVAESNSHNANAYYQRHRALGFTNETSESFSPNYNRIDLHGPFGVGSNLQVRGADSHSLHHRRTY